MIIGKGLSRVAHLVFGRTLSNLVLIGELLASHWQSFDNKRRLKVIVRLLRGCLFFSTIAQVHQK